MKLLITLAFIAAFLNGWCCSRTVKDGHFKAPSSLGDIFNKNRKKTPVMKDFNLHTNFIEYPSGENDLVIMNSIQENYERPEDLDNILTLLNDGTGLDMRQMWEYFSNRMKRIEKRIDHVKSQTSEILSRLSTVDCSTLAEGSPSGMYNLYIGSRATHAVRAKCDQETEGGGWTIILQRIAHESEDLATNFSRELRDYKVGFGDPETDFWIGLENVNQLSNSRDYQLRIDLEDFKGDTAFAHYEKFYLEDESHGYRMQVSGYRGNAGDSLTNLGKLDNYTAAGMMFSTYDEDRDTSHEINCSQHWAIGGWWFNRCSWANLMGPYRLPETGNGIGINWHMWRNKEYIKAASMMIRPTRSYN
uniref:Techylectin-5A-like n=1 Tax=Hirondellea gigas TaxID=1518452 RepID=A0A2P2HXJ3_9CRUS